MALRYIAHTNGCDLVFASVKEKTPLKMFKAILNCHTFDVPTSSIGTTATNPADTILVAAGKDSLGKIDDPDGAHNRQASLE